MAYKYFKLLTVLIAIAAIIWLVTRFKGCGGTGSSKDTVTVRIDTINVNKKDTVYVEKLIPYKVEYVKKVVLHDTLETFETANVDTARILDQYFAKRFYSEAYNIQYGTATINDTVTQNRITGRSIMLNQNIPIVKETITLTQPKRAVLLLGIQAFGNQQYLPYASGVTIDLKLKNDGVIGFGGYLTRTEPMYSANIKFPIHLRKH